MSVYSHVLVAVDLSEDSPAVSRRGRDLAARCDAKLSFVDRKSTRLNSSH